MQDLRGKVAAVTGGGSGLGRAMALTFAREGMDVALADVDMAAAESVADDLRALGVRAITRKVDVSDRAQVGAFADAVFEQLGGCHILCNNAGVVVFRPAHEMSDADWDWVVGVDLLGVIYGIQAFLKRMVAQGEGGHIVNTSSINGVVPLPGIASYTTSKYGVVGLSEALEIDLKPVNIGVSVLCPGLVRTGIANSGRNRPDEYGGPQSGEARVQAGIDATGFDPMEVGALVLRAVRENQLYIFTHEMYRQPLKDRFERMLAAHDWAPVK